MKRLAYSFAVVPLSVACSSSPPPIATPEPAASSAAAPIASSPPPASTSTSPDAAAPVVCTMEVKRCPDGTEVGRSGPNCEFAACPKGKTCSTNADCDKDQICLGEAGCDATWSCVKSPPCTRDLVTYCGCDGKTFQGSGSCAGRKFKKKGAC